LIAVRDQKIHRVGLSGAGFSPRDLVFASTEPQRLKPALLESLCIQKEFLISFRARQMARQDAFDM
jgi:hypothetical protein